MAATRKSTKKTAVGARVLDVVNFLSVAYDDYVAARVLLLAAMLPQGAMLAATAVEKYLKAIVAIPGNRCDGHITERLLRAIENYQPALHKALNLDFVRFLGRAYELRYLDNARPGFGIVINQYRTLAALDRMIAQIDRGFSLARNGAPIDTRYRAEVKRGDEPLLRENHVLDGMGLDDYFSRENAVYDLRVDKAGDMRIAMYRMVRVSNRGSFLKMPNLQHEDDPTRGTLSLG